MGKCRYCNLKAGLFREAHDTCAQEAITAIEDLRLLVADAIRHSSDAHRLSQRMGELATAGRLRFEEVQNISVKAADDATFDIAMASPVSNEEHERIGSLFQSLDQDLFSKPGRLAQLPGFLSLVHSNTLHQVMHGQVPHYNPEIGRDFVLRRGEEPISRRIAQLAEYRTVSTGHSYESVSLPIGNGVYYRLGASHPRATQTGLVPVDEGLMLITILFSGQTNNFRLTFDSVLRVESFTDAFGIHPNHGRGKVFIPAKIGTIDEGWYFHNLVSALVSLR